MNLNKKATALSLACIIAFGITGCNPGGSPVSPSASQSVDSKEKSPKEAVRLETMKTMDKIHALKSSPEFVELHEKLAYVPYATKEDMSHIRSIFEENSDLVEEAKSLVGYSENNKAQVINMLKAYGHTESIKDEKMMGDLLEISVFNMDDTKTSKVKGELSYQIIPDMVQEVDGKSFVTGDYVYTQDENGAVINFPFTKNTKIHLEDGGKRIIVESISDAPPPRAPEWYILQSDVKNAAVVVETWIVSQKGSPTEITVEDNVIVSGLYGKPPEKYRFKMDEGTTITVEGNANAYTIKGTYQDSEEVALYDNQKGGLQNDPVKNVKSEPKIEPGVDYTLWEAHLDKIYRNYPGGIAEDGQTIEDAVSKLNEDPEAEASYDATEKNGKKYIKVTGSESKLSAKGDLLWAYDWAKG